MENRSFEDHECPIEEKLRSHAMKVICLLGSPRQAGNSATIAGRFTDTAVKLGAEARTFELNQLIYHGCQGCYACKTKRDTCVLKDDLTEILEAIRKADVLVLATPVYCRDITGQLKCFIDRTFSYLVPDYTTNPKPSRLPPGKKLVFIITQEARTKEVADIYPRYDDFLRPWVGFASFLIRACGVENKGKRFPRGSCGKPRSWHERL
jgi:multimeric flavodoxin WrbA